MLTLYPAIQPYAVRRLAVDGGHTLYIEECGAADGLPVLFLHGGPGAGCEPVHRRFFDPEIYRIVLFDQRGCGRSTPHAGLNANTTRHLVSDIEAIRSELNIERWVVFGGSWGATLALAYAQAYPERVLGLILRGIFLGREQDIQWFYRDGARHLFPDVWENFIEPIPENERDDLVRAYYRRLTGCDELERLRAARAWALWEGSTMALQHDSRVLDQFSSAHTALSLARIEAHYFVNSCFLEPDQLLLGCGNLKGIRGVIVHGRYDVITPLSSAWALAGAWQEADLHIVGGAGHSASEPGNIDALINATRNIAAQVA